MNAEFKTHLLTTPFVLLQSFSAQDGQGFVMQPVTVNTQLGSTAYRSEPQVTPRALSFNRRVSNQRRNSFRASAENRIPPLGPDGQRQVTLNKLTLPLAVAPTHTTLHSCRLGTCHVVVLRHSSLLQCYTTSTSDNDVMLHLQSA